MRQRGNDIEGRTDAPGICSLDYYDQFSPRIAAVDLRAMKCLDCFRGCLKAFRPRLYKDAGDFHTGGQPVVVRAYPPTVHEFAAIDTARHRTLGHDTLHFDGGPGGPLIVW